MSNQFIETCKPLKPLEYFRQPSVALLLWTAILGLVIAGFIDNFLEKLVNPLLESLFPTEKSQWNILMNLFVQLILGCLLVFLLYLCISHPPLC